MVTPSAAIKGGGKQALSAALGKPGLKARGVQLIGDAANSETCLVGGPNLVPGSASPLVQQIGFPIPKASASTSFSPLYLPYSSVWTELYDFDQIYVYVAPGDVLYVLYEQG